MIFMPLSVTIDANIQNVFDILNTPQLNNIWNPVTHTVTPDKNNPNKCTVVSFMGNFDTEKTTTEPTNVTLKINNSPVLKELRYDLVSISSNQTRVHGNVIFAGTGHYETIHKAVGEKLLNNLKRYVEHHKAGLPDEQFVKEL